MFWEDEKEEEVYRVPDDVVDLVFALESAALPVDHAYALSQAVRALLPWLGEEPGAGIHAIHGGESGNGWQRPDEADALIHISRRTKLVLRLPKQRLEEAGSLSGARLDVAGHPLQVGKSAVRPLSAHTTVYARYVVDTADQGEEAFLARCLGELRDMGVQARKLVCGRARRIRTPEGELHARSLMIADVSLEEAVRLQQQGLGPARELGCGLFIPHKGINVQHERG